MVIHTVRRACGGVRMRAVGSEQFRTGGRENVVRSKRSADAVVRFVRCVGSSRLRNTRAGWAMVVGFGAVAAPFRTN